MLLTLVCLLAAAVLAVPLARRAGVGGVLGYLVAGAVIGPAGLRLVSDVGQISEVSELGVVMLLFLIGLELRPARLWLMRRAVVGLGLGQVAATAAVIGLLSHVLGGIGWAGALVLGLGLALSSTAIVLPMLGERDLLAGRAGRDAFAILLAQDISFIPLVALVPLLATGAAPSGMLPWREVGIGAAAIGLILVGGRYALRPAFRLIGGARVPEMFTLLALLSVAGAAAIAQTAGLSASLGAFLAGVLLSESEYRHELRADIEPFEGLLLGFFFMSVGMSADLSLVLAAPGKIAIALLLMMLAKIGVAWLLGRLWREPASEATRLATALPQGSEFSFVLFAAAVGVGALEPQDARLATLVVALSMVATPLLFAASERLVIPRLSHPEPEQFDEIEADAPVIIAGFGRVGQVVGRLLRTQGIPFTALERDPGQVEVIRRFGTKIFYGDPARPDLLHAAGAASARLLVVAVENTEDNLRIAEVARRTFPNLQVLARARNRRHVHLLMDRGIENIVRDTFYSALKMGGMALQAMGVEPARVEHAKSLFVEHDERLLRDQYAIYRDEDQLIQTSRQAAAELQSLFEADQPGQAGNPAPPRAIAPTEA